jgi:ATP-dependent RNA helicase RhlE
MSFLDFGLHESLQRVLPEIGYEKPTPIQQQAIPLVLTGKDLLGSAQTGTGKTAAFLLPVLHRLLSEPALGTQVLVLEPTRELALQVEEQAKVFSKYTQLRSACVYGGVAFGPQEKAFADGVEVIAATPGRLLDHLRQGNARFDKLRVLVLDEVDRMLDMGFLPDVRAILRQLPEQRQTLFFSATVPSEIGRLAEGMLKDPSRVAITPERKTAEGITQQVYQVPEHLKPKLLELLLSHEHVTSALVFTRTKQGADKVCAVVERQGLPVARIHGDLSQIQRAKALTAFKEGQVKFLVATDIAARGLDVEGISHVINYDLPESPEDYVHRIGRTARAGETGHAYSLQTPRDAAALAGIEKHLSQKIEKIIMPNFDYTETLGVQHEVRQGHNVRDFEDLGRPGAGPIEVRPRPFKDADERASLVLLFSANSTAAEAESAPENDGGRGYGSSSGSSSSSGDGDGKRRRRRGRGGRGGRGEGDEPRRGPSSSAPQGGQRQAERPAHDAGHAPRQDRHQANASLSATDVLRKASDQKAVVSSDMMELRPRGEADDDGDDYEEAPRPAAAGAHPGQAQAGAPGEGGKRKRRRRRRGKGGDEARQGQGFQPAQAGAPRRDQPARPGQGRFDRGGNGRHERHERGDRNDRGERPSAAPKVSLWQRLKSSLGLGSGGGGLGDKW